MQHENDYAHAPKGEFYRQEGTNIYVQNCKCGHQHPETFAGSRIPDKEKGLRTPANEIRNLVTSKETSEVVFAFT